MRMGRLRLRLPDGRRLCLSVSPDLRDPKSVRKGPPDWSRLEEAELDDRVVTEYHVPPEQWDAVLDAAGAHVRLGKPLAMRVLVDVEGVEFGPPEKAE